MKVTRKILTYVVIMCTAFLAALSYQLFVFPNKFAPAGLNGLCTMIQYALGIKVSVLNLIINIPLALLVMRVVSRPLAVRSLCYTLFFSLSLLILDYVPLEQFAYNTANGTSKILGPMVAGIINGFCYSVVIRGGSYTGGLDYVAALIQVKKPETNFMRITFLLNSMVAITSYFVYGYQIEPVLLCIIYCYLTSTVSDRILRNERSAVKFEIVTPYPDEISKEIVTKLRHSGTRVEGVGVYSGESTTLLLCVVNKSQILEFENIIRSYPDTFAYLSTVKEVVGNFKHLKKNGQVDNPLLDDGSDGIL